MKKKFLYLTLLGIGMSAQNKSFAMNFKTLNIIPDKYVYVGSDALMESCKFSCEKHKHHLNTCQDKEEFFYNLFNFARYKFIHDSFNDEANLKYEAYMTFIQNMKIEINNFLPDVLTEQNERNDFPPLPPFGSLEFPISSGIIYQDVRKTVRRERHGIISPALLKSSQEEIAYAIFKGDERIYNVFKETEILINIFDSLDYDDENQFQILRTRAVEGLMNINYIK